MGSLEPFEAPDDDGNEVELELGVEDYASWAGDYVGDRGVSAGGGSAGSTPPGAGLEWARSMRETYFAVQEVWCALEGVETRCDAARARSQKTEMALRASKRHLELACDARARAIKSAENASRTGFSRKFRKNEYEREVAEAKSAQERAEVDVSKFSKEVELFRGRGDVARGELGALEAGVRRRKALDVKRKKVLDDLFRGYQAGDPAENAAEKRRDSAKGAEARVKQALLAHMKALSAVTNATSDLESVCRLLQSAMSTNMMDMQMQGTQGLGGMAGQQTYYNMQRAASLATRANRGLAAAKKLSPGIPLANSAKVKQSQFAVMSLFRDSTFSDIRQRYKIQSQLASTVQVHREARAAMRWQERKVNAIRRDLQDAEAAYVSAGNDLLRERERLIQVPI